MTNYPGFETWSALLASKQANVVGLAGPEDRLRLPPTHPALKNVLRFDPQALPAVVAGGAAETFVQEVKRPLIAVLNTGRRVVAFTSLDNAGIELHMLGDDGQHLSLARITDTQPHIVRTRGTDTSEFARVQRRGLMWEIAAISPEGAGIAVHKHATVQKFVNPALLTMAAAGVLPVPGQG